MAFTPEDVLNKNFTATQFRRGYDETEVDDFLDEIVVELRRLVGENDDLRTQLKTCQESRGVIPAETQDKIAAARVSAEQAEKAATARIAKARAGAEQAEAQLAERVKAADAASETAKKAAAAPVAVPASVKLDKQEEPVAADVSGASAAGLGSAAGVLALAQRLHEEYVAEGQTTRERLISEGQSHHDQVVGEAAATREKLLSSSQAKYDELLSNGTAKHDALIAEATSRHDEMITEARERSTGMVAEAQQKRADVLQTLGRERSLLQKKIDELRTFERDYRVRLKSYLEGQLHELEQTGVVNTAESQSEAQNPGQESGEGQTGDSQGDTEIVQPQNGGAKNVGASSGGTKNEEGQ